MGLDPGGMGRDLRSMQIRTRQAALLSACIALLVPTVCGAAAVPGSSSPEPAGATPRILQLEASAKLSSSEQSAVFEEYVLAFRAAVVNRNEALGRELADRATQVFPKRRRAWCHLAAARLRIHQWGPAIEAARAAEAARDDDDPPAALPDETAAGAAYWEGLALYRTQRYAEALPRLRAAHTRAPEWAEAARALGEAAFVAGRAKEAAAAYSAAFAIDPSAGSVHDLAYWAEARSVSGDLDGGIAAIQEALRVAPFEPGLHAKLGDLLRREGQLADAYYELLLEGLLHGSEGRFTAPAVSMAQAIVDSLRTMHEVAQNHELMTISAGLASLDAGQPHLAIHQLQHALTITRSASPVPHLLLADALYRDSQSDPARAVLEETLVTYPDFVPALELLSNVYTRLGRPREAKAARERALALFPEYWKMKPKPGRS